MGNLITDDYNLHELYKTVKGYVLSRLGKTEYMNLDKITISYKDSIFDGKKIL